MKTDSTTTWNQWELWLPDIVKSWFLNPQIRDWLCIRFTTKQNIEQDKTHKCPCIFIACKVRYLMQKLFHLTRNWLEERGKVKLLWVSPSVCSLMSTVIVAICCRISESEWYAWLGKKLTPAEKERTRRNGTPSPSRWGSRQHLVHIMFSASVYPCS